MIDSLKFLQNSSEFIDFNFTENRVLAENIYSKQNIPKYDNSAIDGFAINYGSFKKVDFFKVVGESKPGKPFKKKLKEGEAIAIYTGSYILDINNIDTVCYEENCQLKNKNLNIVKKPIKGSNIRKKGEDVKKIRSFLKREERFVLLIFDN